MGTRSDYYTGLDPQTWLGSAHWDGYPAGMRTDLLAADHSTQEQWTKAVLTELTERTDTVTACWPWRWDTSSTTDYAYTWHDGEVLVSGEHFWVPIKAVIELDKHGLGWHELESWGDGYKVDHPDMSGRRDPDGDGYGPGARQIGGMIIL